jgi:hypothetical protein
MVYIWVRRTTDWADEQAVRAQLSPRLVPKVELWNDTFDIPFHLFRQELCRIAELSWSRVDGAVRAEWDEIPEGALVLPVDDDDWFAPDLARVLEERHEPGLTGHLWISSFIEVPMHRGHRLYLIRRRLLPWTPPKFVCTTNNYALVKSPATKELLREHRTASQWFKEGGKASMKRIDRRLSVMNRSLASSTALAYTRVDRAALLHKHSSYRKLYRGREPRGLEWCRPYRTMMAELMERLTLRESGKDP